jgi:hypothetical protein
VATRVQSYFKSCGIRGWWCGSGAGFLWVLRFPLPILVPSSRAGTISQLVADVPSGLSLTPPRETK